MDEAVDRNFTSNMDIKIENLKYWRNRSIKIYLSENELLNIYNLDLTGNSRLEKVRDLFISVNFSNKGYT